MEAAHLAHQNDDDTVTEKTSEATKSKFRGDNNRLQSPEKSVSIDELLDFNKQSAA